MLYTFSDESIPSLPIPIVRPTKRPQEPHQDQPVSIPSLPIPIVRPTKRPQEPHQDQPVSIPSIPVPIVRPTKRPQEPPQDQPVSIPSIAVPIVRPTKRPQEPPQDQPVSIPSIATVLIPSVIEPTRIPKRRKVIEDDDDDDDIEYINVVPMTNQRGNMSRNAPKNASREKNKSVSEKMKQQAITEKNKRRPEFPSSHEFYQISRDRELSTNSKPISKRLSTDLTVSLYSQNDTDFVQEKLTTIRWAETLLKVFIFEEWSDVNKSDENSVRPSLSSSSSSSSSSSKMRINNTITGLKSALKVKNELSYFPHPSKPHVESDNILDEDLSLQSSSSDSYLYVDYDSLQFQKTQRERLSSLSTSSSIPTSYPTSNSTFFPKSFPDTASTPTAFPSSTSIPISFPNTTSTTLVPDRTASSSPNLKSSSASLMMRGNSSYSDDPSSMQGIGNNFQKPTLPHTASNFQSIIPRTSSKLIAPTLASVPTFPQSPVLPLSPTTFKSYMSMPIFLPNCPRLPPNPPVVINNSQQSYLPINGSQQSNLPIHSTLQLSSNTPAPAPPLNPPLPHAPPPPIRPVLPIEQIPLPPPREIKNVSNNPQVNKDMFKTQTDAEINMPTLAEIQTLKSVPIIFVGASMSGSQESHPNKENNDRLQLLDNRVGLIKNHTKNFSKTNIENENKNAKESVYLPHTPTSFFTESATSISSSSVLSYPSATSVSMNSIVGNADRDSSISTAIPPSPPPTSTSTYSSSSSSVALVSVTPAPIPRPSVNQYYIARFEVPR